MTFAPRITAIALTLGLASPLLAQGIDAAIDTDSSGTYSLEELQVMTPDLSQDTFATYDLSGDGQLDADEAAAMQAAGLIPATEG